MKINSSDEYFQSGIFMWSNPLNRSHLLNCTDTFTPLRSQMLMRQITLVPCAINTKGKHMGHHQNNISSNRSRFSWLEIGSYQLYSVFTISDDFHQFVNKQSQWTLGEVFSPLIVFASLLVTDWNISIVSFYITDRPLTVCLVSFANSDRLAVPADLHGSMTTHLKDINL